MNQVLVVDDEAGMRAALEASFRRQGWRVTTASGTSEALERFRSAPCPLVVTDMRMPDGDGLRVMQGVRALAPGTAVIFLTAFANVPEAVNAMRAGACDYVLKPFSLDEIKIVIRRELDVLHLRRENRNLREALGQRYEAPGIVADSPKMQEVLALVERVAQTNSTVLICGESGVGKDLVARAIHLRSRRAAGPFVKINSTAIPETLLESELFGYEKGAFTGAVGSKPGKFEMADGGTLFLDEIGDVPPPVQVKLLRVLQEREFERLGGTRTIKVDVRLVAATNRDLRAALEEGTFREDLYYRLNVVPINIPPLREHREDIPALAALFLQKYAGPSGKKIESISPAALERLTRFHWPGNVRELENVIERAVALSPGPVIQPGDILIDEPAAVRGGPASAETGFLPEGMTLEQWEDEMIREAMRRAAGNKSQAARLLGLSRNALRYRLSKLGFAEEPET